jgi:hypothetical protein
VQAYAPVVPSDELLPLELARKVRAAATGAAYGTWRTNQTRLPAPPITVPWRVRQAAQNPAQMRETRIRRTDVVNSRAEEAARGHEGLAPAFGRQECRPMIISRLTKIA